MSKNKVNVTPLVIKEIPEKIAEREQTGIRKYGESLMTFNGRNPYTDTQEELLDALQYNRQSELEHIAVVNLLNELIVSLNKSKELASVKEQLLSLRESIGNPQWEEKYLQVTSEQTKTMKWIDQILEEAAEILNYVV